MPLTEQQVMTLQAIDWLFDDQYRQQGRTTVWAIGIIRAAIRQPRHDVEIETIIYPEQRARQHLVNVVRDMCMSDDVLRPIAMIDMRRHMLRIEGQADPNWLPAHLCGTLVGAVPETVQPESASLLAKPIPSVWERLMCPTW